jgi:hypothetical protein
MSDDANPSVPSQAAPSQAITSSAADRSRRRRLLRFGLRTALIVALVFCLLMGWIGRNFVQVRREDAAIEALKQAGATIYVGSVEEYQRHPETPHQFEPPNWDGVPSFGSRLIGWSGRAPVIYAYLTGDDPEDEKVRNALAALAQFPELEVIEFSGAAFTDESLDALTPLPNLHELALVATGVTGEGLARIASPERFRRAVLKPNSPPSDVIAGLSAMRELRYVQVYDGPVSREDLEVLAALPKLESLSLLLVRPSGADFYAPLAKAQGLKELDVRHSSFGDANAHTVARLTRLERLVIDGIADDGLAELASLTNLRYLNLVEPVWPAAVRAFSAAHERCLVAYRTSEGIDHYLAGEAIDDETARAIDAAAKAASADD